MTLLELKDTIDEIVRRVKRHGKNPDDVRVILNLALGDDKISGHENMDVTWSNVHGAKCIIIAESNDSFTLLGLGSLEPLAETLRAG